MVFKYLATAALAAGSTYGALSLGAQDTPIQAITCAYEAEDGTPLAIEHGPLGPRLGSLEYVASNLTHEEKIQLVSSSSFDSPGIIEQMLLDLVRNREDVIDDIKHSIEYALEEAF